MNKKLSLAILLMCGLFMITAPLPFGFAAEEEGGSGSGGDSGGDNGSDSQSKDEGGDEGKSGESSDSSESNDKSGDSSGDNTDDQEKEKTNTVEEHNKIAEQNRKDDEQKLKDSGLVIGKGGKPTKESLDAYEKEQAAIEDYINEEPGEKQPYPPVTVTDKPIPPVTDKPITETTEDTSHRTEETENNDSCNYYGRNICEGSKDGKTCNDDKFDCLSDTKDGNYCTTGQCPGDDQKWDCKK
ncbi:MAG TPA: hypothetical protein VF220_01460, partial [Nitrososphaeraceae archaeon]